MLRYSDHRFDEISTSILSSLGSEVNTMIFSKTEMQARVDRLQTIMAAQDIDVVIVSSYHGNLYYAGFWMLPMGRFNITIIPASGPAEIIAPIMERDRLPTYSWITDTHFYGDEGASLAGLVGITKELLADRGYALDRIGVEKVVMPVAVFETMFESQARGIEAV